MTVCTAYLLRDSLLLQTAFLIEVWRKRHFERRSEGVLFSLSGVYLIAVKNSHPQLIAHSWWLQVKTLNKLANTLRYSRSFARAVLNFE